MKESQKCHPLVLSKASLLSLSNVHAYLANSCFLVSYSSFSHGLWGQKITSFVSVNEFYGVSLPYGVEGFIQVRVIFVLGFQLDCRQGNSLKAPLLVGPGP